TLALPSGLPAGGRYLLFVSDDGNAVTEADEANNVRAVWISIPATPDFNLTASAPASALVGGPVAVSFTVTNAGSADAFAGYDGTKYVSWYDAVYVSNDNVLDSGDTFA